MYSVASSEGRDPARILLDKTLDALWLNTSVLDPIDLNGLIRVHALLDAAPTPAARQRLARALLVQQGWAAARTQAPLRAALPRTRLGTPRLGRVRL